MLTSESVPFPSRKGKSNPSPYCKESHCATHSNSRQEPDAWAQASSNHASSHLSACPCSKLFARGFGCLRSRHRTITAQNTLQDEGLLRREPERVPTPAWSPVCRVPPR